MNFALERCARQLDRDSSRSSEFGGIDDMAERKGLTQRELSTVLAALRYWQQGKCCDLEIQSIAADTGSELPDRPLDAFEIDDLCEALNFGSVVPTLDVLGSDDAVPARS